MLFCILTYLIYPTPASLSQLHSPLDLPPIYPWFLKNKIIIVVVIISFFYHLQVCCVAFRVSEDEELHWLIPYVKDIMEKKLEATPFLSKIDISGKKGRNKLTRTIERFQKYNLRGYKPTPKLLEMCGLSAEEGIIGRIANLKM